MPYKTFLKQFLLFMCELRTFDTPKKVENEKLKITYETKMKLKNYISKGFSIPKQQFEIQQQQKSLL